MYLEAPGDPGPGEDFHEPPGLFLCIKRFVSVYESQATTIAGVLDGVVFTSSSSSKNLKTIELQQGLHQHRCCFSPFRMKLPCINVYIPYEHVFLLLGILPPRKGRHQDHPKEVGNRLQTMVHMRFYKMLAHFWDLIDKQREVPYHNLHAKFIQAAVAEAGSSGPTTNEKWSSESLVSML